VPVDVDPLVETVCESLLPTAEGKSLTLTARTSGGGAMVLGDEHQLERLLLNLVSNAVKFTPPGGRVLVSCSISSSSVILSVADTGIGIPADEQEAVFGRFFRGAEATQEVIPGTGLGLAIVQAIVEHLGGTLTLHSAAGQGTTVRVRLPSLAVAEAQRELEAQGAAVPADTEEEDLLPVGVGSAGGAQDVPDATRRSEARSKERQR
jgi:signal transduction histidine kinase